MSSGFPLFVCEFFGPCSLIISTSDPEEVASILPAINSSEFPIMLLTSLETNHQACEAIRGLRPEVGEDLQAGFAFFIRNGVGLGPSKVEAICEGHLIHQHNESVRLQQCLHLIRQPDERIVQAPIYEPFETDDSSKTILWGKCFAKCFRDIRGPVPPWTSHFIRYNGKTWSFHFNSTKEEVEAHLEAARKQGE